MEKMEKMEKMETWTHRYINSWTHKHMETWYTWRHGIKILGNSDVLPKKSN
jgi:hypothetical protein